MMQCLRAKTNHLIRRQAIKHYLHNKRTDTFTFLSLWNDEEPYPLNELITAQLFYVDGLKADAKEVSNPEHIASLIKSEECEELTLQRLQALQKQRGK